MPKCLLRTSTAKVDKRSTRSVTKPIIYLSTRARRFLGKHEFSTPRSDCCERADNSASEVQGNTREEKGLQFLLPTFILYFFFQTKYQTNLLYGRCENFFVSSTVMEVIFDLREKNSVGRLSSMSLTLPPPRLPHDLCSSNLRGTRLRATRKNVRLPRVIRPCAIGRGNADEIFRTKSLGRFRQRNYIIFLMHRISSLVGSYITEKRTKTKQEEN